MSIPYAAPIALTCRQIRAVDALAIAKLGIPSLLLMENAGRAAAECIWDRLREPQREHVVVLCGPGNNGGDGFVITRHLSNAGVAVTTVLSTPAKRMEGDAAANLRIIEHMELPIIDGSDPEGLALARQQVATASVIVDALLGTGSSGAPRGNIAELIVTANDNRNSTRIAIDIPSGLNADTGEVSEPCFTADATITFVAAKTGFEQPAARRVLGEIVVAGIGVPRSLIDAAREAPANGNLHAAAHPLGEVTGSPKPESTTPTVKSA